MTKLEIILLVLLCLTVFLVIAYFLSGKILLFISIKRGNYLGRAISRKFARLSKRFKVKYNWWEKFPNEIFNIKSNDNLNLYARILRQQEKTNKVAIVVHGFMNSYKDMQPYCKLFYDMGYNVLAPDNRAHGMSQGEYVGMGWQDRLDLLLWIDYVIKHFGKKTQIVLFGLSMGGATVCMASGEVLPENVKAIIADSAFNNVFKIFEHVSKKEFYFSFFAHLLNSYSKFYFGESPKQQDAIAQVKKSKVPIFIIHGNEDDFVPVNMAYELFDAINPELRRLYIAKNSWHGEAFVKHTQTYKKNVKDFLEKNIK